MSSPGSHAPPYPIGSVANALRLLLLLGDRERLTVTESARTLGVAPSTAHRLLSMLEYFEFVTRVEGERGFSAGPALLGLGLTALQQLDVRRVARPHIETLVAELEETVNLIVLEGSAVRFVDCVESPKALRIASRIGLRRPAHTTSVGKVLLGALSTKELDQLYGPDAPFDRLTERSVPDRARLEMELRRARELGYATNLGESDPDIRAVGVAIFGAHGRPVAGLAASAPASRLPEARIANIAGRLKRTALNIEAALLS